MPKRCFVIMGFGKKTDYATGRVLDLDATYESIIKPAVDAAGLECVRADEIMHSGFIDVPMYEQLQGADVVIADLSTANPNVFYELGVRHALRPYSTIVIAERQLQYPFDTNHTVIHQYEHLGSDIGFNEAQRARAELQQAIAQIVDARQTDSPVYTYLQGLRPPILEAKQTAAPALPAEADTNTPTIAALMQAAEDAIRNECYPDALWHLHAARALRHTDPYITQRLALATALNRNMPQLVALEDAKRLLEALDPSTSTDPETLRLWGLVHTQLWEAAGDRADLDQAILAHEKGFTLQNDYYNGISQALLLSVRAAELPPREAIADVVNAERVWQRVIEVCESRLDHTVKDSTLRFWLRASVAEAWLGLGNRPRHKKALERAFHDVPDPRLREEAEARLRRLEECLGRAPRFDGAPVVTPNEPPPLSEAAPRPAAPARLGAASEAEPTLAVTGSIPAVFVSYSRSDTRWLKQLQQHLTPAVRHGKLDLWDDTQIKAGDDWRASINAALAAARAAILLVSPQFLSSDFITNDELPPLLQAARDRGVRIFWVPLSTTSYEDTAIANFQAAWSPRRPLDKLSTAERNQAWVEICRQVKEALLAFVRPA